MGRGKKFLLVFLLVLALTGFWLTDFYEARPNHYEEVYVIDEVIVIGGDNYFPPFEYMDENDVYRGFNVDLMNAIALEMGLNIELRPKPWYLVLQSLESGEIDAVQGMKYSETREEIYAFSDAYLTSSLSIFVQTDNLHVVNLQDLSGKRVAVQKFDVSIDLIVDVPDIEIIETENQEEALQKLYNEEVDASIGNRLVGLYVVQKNSYQDRIKIVGEEINPEKYALATKRDNAHLIPLFNEGLERIKEKGTYDTIYSKWFGQPIHSPPDYVRKILAGSIALFVFSIMIAFIFYKWNDILKKEVEKRTEELKRESNFKEQTLNSIFSALMTLDKKGEILYVNAKGEAYLNTPKDKLIGKKLTDTSAAEYIDENLYREVIDTMQSKIGLQQEIEKEDESRIFEYNICPLKVSEDEIFGVTITFKDVTDMKMLQEKILVKDKLESLGRLTAGIAHEIRNPLTTIKAYVELIPEKYHKEDFRKKISVDVPKEIRRLNEIITNLLNYSKPQKSTKELCPVKEVMEETIEFFSSEAKQNHVQIVKQLDDHAYILADVQQFRQIVINLLLNALQAANQVEDSTILISARKTANKVVVEIQDNGKGIETKNQDKIFDPFFTTKKEGSGLGLAICYQFVKENNGDIYVKSRKGKGTMFTMVFPEANQPGNGVREVR